AAVPERRRDRRQAGLRDGGVQGLPHAEGRGCHRDGRAESRPGEATALARRRARDEGPGRDAALQGADLRQADCGRRRVRREGDRRQPERLTLLAPDFPRDVEVVATDFDRTLVWEDGTLRPRTLHALRAAREAGLHVIVVTGRMVQSVRRFLAPAELDEPVICYQGAVVADENGKGLRHEPIPLELAKEAAAALKEEGYDPNVYIDDELYVSHLSKAARDYAGFQDIPIHEVGDTLDWLTAPPTKLVCVGDPDALDGVEVRAKRTFGDRLYIS